jgi:hypothetical protein
MINPILERLNKVRPSGNNSWRACCPAHDGNNPSALTIREEPDGRILMHCFQGCSAVDVMGAIGLDVTELFPEPIAHHSKPVSRKFYATDILAAIRVECQIVMLAAFELEKGRKLPEVDLKRLRLAMERINESVEMQ